MNSLGKHPSYSRILVIRRDNIGDLVCTTPLIRALRSQLPESHIAVLATKYNMAVMEGNPDIDALFSYTKSKHLEHGESRLGIFWSRLKTIWTLRSRRFDWILLPAGPQRSAERFAKWIGARNILIRNEEDRQGGAHHAEQCCHLLVRMGLRAEFPESRLTPSPDRMEKAKALLPMAWATETGPLIALCLSSRKPSQRWSVEHFAEASRILHDRTGAKFLLLWSPGSPLNPRHPGDDDKALLVEAAMKGVPVHPMSTDRVEDLIAALALSDSVICSDGGAMHLASALGKPLVCLFGDSDPEHCGPWKSPHVVIQKPSREVEDISSEEVAEACMELLKSTHAS